MSPKLAPDEDPLTVPELAEEVECVSGAAREELERRGLTKRFHRLALERKRYRRELERLAPDHPVVARENREDEAALERLHGHTARRFAATINGPASSPEEWARMIGTPAAGASRRKLLARVSGKLLASRGGVDPAIVLVLAHLLNGRNCTPPLDAGEVVEVVRWAMAREIERLEGTA